MQAKLYKWVDENGNVTYSQQKPPDAKAQTIDVRGYESPAPAPDSTVDELKDREQTQRKDREFAESENAAQQDRAERMKKNCEIARQNVRILKNASRIKDTNESGEVYYLDDQQKQSRLQEAEQHVKDYC